jgi:hypothetical protein
MDFTRRRTPRTRDDLANRIRSAIASLAAGIAVCLTSMPIGGLAADATTQVDSERTMCCRPSNDQAAAAGHARRAAPVDGSPTDTGPDRVAGYVGGLAARLRDGDGAEVPGDLYLLMATVGSEAPARLYAQTPFTHDGPPRDDTVASNQLAARTVEDITGNEVDMVEFTSAPGGGPSGGLLYTIAYLNIASNGAFTSGLRIAATGEVVDEGYLDPITAPNEKVGAAHLAGVDAIFMTSAPSHPTAAEYAARMAGDPYRTRHGRVNLFEERSLADYQAFGVDRPDSMDIILVGHISDVAAYLCGTGSTYACKILDRLGPTLTSDPDLDVNRNPATDNSIIQAPPLGDPSLGNLR